MSNVRDFQFWLLVRVGELVSVGVKSNIVVSKIGHVGFWGLKKYIFVENLFTLELFIHIHVLYFCGPSK